MSLIIRFFIATVFCLTGARSFAQQNFFNVPSSDITEKNKIFIQQQMNFFSANMASNSTFCTGLGKNLEIGLNLLGVTYDYNKKHLVSSKMNEQPVYPTYGINAQGQLWKFKQYSISLGVQLLFHSAFSRAEWYGYLNNKLELRNVKLIAGLYSGNNNYFGKETRFSANTKDIGFQTGLEYQIISDKLSFQADFISGSTAISNLITGVAYNLNEHWILSAGYQIANNKRSSSNGAIFELTFVQ